MKPSFFFPLLCFLFQIQPVFSDTSPTAQFSREVARQVFGVGNPKSILNCSILLNKTWAYPNAQATSFCNDAETSFVRYCLVEQKIKHPQGADMDKLKHTYALARQDTILKLEGCVLAIEATISGNTSVLEGSGFNGY